MDLSGGRGGGGGWTGPADKMWGVWGREEPMKHPDVGHG